MNSKHSYVSELRFLLLLFLLSVAVNYIWEMLQMPLYEGMPFDTIDSWRMCLKASIGDGFIILAIWTIGRILFGSCQWFAPLSRGRAAVLFVSGIAIAVIIELHALRTGRWAYSSLMPVLPLIDTGLSPVLQLLILPLISMKAAHFVFTRHH